MRRRFCLILPALTGALVIAMGASVARSQDDKKAAAPSAEQAKEMEQMMKAGQPGPEHAKLAEMNGDWDADVTFFSPMGEQKSKGVMHCEMIMGGRVLQMKFQGSMMGMDGKPAPFQGIGMSGYDNAEKKYWNFWVDDMGTGCMITKGTLDGNVMTAEGEMVDPSNGKPTKVKEVTTLVDKDHQKFEMLCAGPDGNMMKVMEINYTKKS
jgi:hypothetical protein